MATNRPRFTTTTTVPTKISVRISAALAIISVSALFGLLVASLGIQAINRSLKIAITGAATGSSYPFPGSVKVFGQRSITQTSNGAIVGNRVFHPAGLTVDSSRALYVADAINNRILAFRSIGSCFGNFSKVCSTDADCGTSYCVVNRNRLPEKVIGQANFNSGACNRDNNIGVNGNATASSLCFVNYPKITNLGEYGFRIRMTTDAQGDLYVVDAMNNRILRYNQPLGTSTVAGDGKGDAIADYVWGQADFSGHLPNRGGSVTKNSLSLENQSNSYGPGIAIDDAGNLWVADTNNARVLRFPVDATGVPARDANRVIGQISYGSSTRTCDPRDPNSLNPVPPINNRFPEPTTSLTSFCYPGAIQFDKTSQTLYVADQQARRFWSRLLAYRSINTGAANASEIVIQNPNFASFNYLSGFSGSGTQIISDFHYYPQIWDMTLNADTATTGLMWIAEGITERATLIDRQGMVIKAVNAIDINHRGGSWSNACKQTYYDNGHQQGPGALAMDTHGNLYLADNILHKVSILNAQRYQPVTINDSLCLPPTGIKSLFGRPDGWMNGLDKISYDGSFGAIAWNGQLIGKGNQRLMVWNNYKTIPSGAPADFVLGKSNEDRGLTQPENARLGGAAHHAIDSLNRLWTSGDGNEIIVYQLPLTVQSIPIARYTMDALIWSDTGSVINAVDPDGIKRHIPNPISFAYDVRKHRMWLNDGSNNRLLGFRINQSISNSVDAKLIIDKVIGQPNKSTTGCNSANNAWSWTASAVPTDKTLCQPTVVKLDRLGNLYALEGTYECHGNNRIVMYSRQTLKDIDNNNSLFPYPTASKVFIAKLFNDFPTNCDTGNKKPGHPTGIAFSSTNQMIVGTDGFYDPIEQRATNQIFFYNNPLLKDANGNYVTGDQSQLPDAVIPIPMGATGEINFDDSDNLLIQDHTWPRILMINYNEEPRWLTPINSGLAGSISIGTISDGQAIAPGTSLGVALAKFNLTNQTATVTLINKNTGNTIPVYRGTNNIFTLTIPPDIERGEYWLKAVSDATGAQNDLRLVAIATGDDLLITSPQINSVLYAGSKVHIAWKNYNTSAASFRIVLNKSDGTLLTLIADNLGAAVSAYDWTIPPGLPTGSYKLRVNSTISQPVLLGGTTSASASTGDEIPVVVPTFDGTPPTVSITAPVNGASVSGSSYLVAATSTDTVGVTKVEFWDNGILSDVTTTTPYTFAWNTTLTYIRTHLLQVKAYDRAGNVGRSATTTVSVFPLIMITAPATLLYVNPITVNMLCNMSVTKVEIFDSSVLLKSIPYPGPYTFSWSPTSLTGSHLIGAKAYDVTGNMRTSGTTAMSITPTADNVTPIASICSLINGQTVSGIINIIASAFDNIGVTVVELWKDGALFKTVSAAPYTFSLDTASLTSGKHSLQVRAYDVAGRMGVSGIVTVIK